MIEEIIGKFEFTKLDSGVDRDPDWVEIKRLAILGAKVEAMKPSHFIGRDYTTIHDVAKEWDYCQVDYGSYINLGKGPTSMAAFEDADRNHLT